MRSIASPAYLKAILIILIGLVLGCESPNTGTSIAPLYFDLTSLLNEQSKVLNEAKPGAIKLFAVNGIQGTRKILNINWNEELKIFREGDINAAVLREIYSLKHYTKESKYYTSYIPKEKIQNGVTELIVVYNKEKVLQSILFSLSTHNWLYYSKRQFLLKFKSVKQMPSISEYQIKNFQKLIFKEPTKTFLSTKLIY